MSDWQEDEIKRMMEVLDRQSQKRREYIERLINDRSTDKTDTPTDIPA